MTPYHIAAIAWEIGRMFEFTLAGAEEARPTWEDAQPWERDQMLKWTKEVLLRPDVLPDEWHEIQVEEDKKAGWVFGYVMDAEKKEDPLMAEWDELPPHVQNMKYVVWGTIIAVASKSNMLDYPGLVKLDKKFSPEAVKEAMGSMVKELAPEASDGE